MAKRILKRIFPVGIRTASIRAAASEGESKDGASGHRAEIVMSSDAPYLRQSWDGPFYEVLSHDPKHVRMDRMNNGAPVLNAHNSSDLRDVIGVVESAQLDKNQAVASVRFSTREDVAPIVQDVKDGIIQNASIGYKVYKFEKVKGAEGDIPTLRAVDWEPHEVSMVPVGADDNAGTRGASAQAGNDCEFIMEDEAMFKRNSAGQLIEVETGNVVTEEYARSKGWQHDGYKPPTAPAKPTEEQTAAARAEGVRAERKRVQEIDDALRSAKLDDAAFRAELIGDGEKDGVDIGEARKRILAKMAEQTDKTPINGHHVRVTDSDRDKLSRGIEVAILHRARPSAFKLDEGGNPFRGLSMVEIARECLNLIGVNTRGLDKMKLVSLALNNTRAAGQMSTSDFPLILANVANKVLRAGYDVAPRTFQPWSRRVTLPDFKLKTLTQLGEGPALKALGEGGEYNYGVIGEGSEQYKLGTFGVIVALTRQAIINDDLGAFERIIPQLGQSAAYMESDVVYSELTANAAMGDGVALFHATHNNLSPGGAAAFAAAPLGEMRAAMRKQTGLATGEDAKILNLVLRYVLVPADLEFDADQLLSSIIPAQVANAVPAFIRSLSVIVEPRLDADSATAYYGVADPGQVDTLEYGYLDGNDAPFIESREGFEVDGVEIKVRHDFGAKVVDWRGFQKNVGA